MTASGMIGWWGQANRHGVMFCGDDNDGDWRVKNVGSIKMEYLKYHKSCTPQKKDGTIHFILVPNSLVEYAWLALLSLLHLARFA